MEKRIPFDIKYRPEIEAGKYLVVTRNGELVRIICWDKKGNTPIVALIKTRSPEVVETFFTNGAYFRDGESDNDLFLVPNPDYKEPVTEQSSVDWDAFRREAAKDFVSAILSNSALVDYPIWEHRIIMIGSGVACADELIKQLKEGKK